MIEIINSILKRLFEALGWSAEFVVDEITGALKFVYNIFFCIVLFFASILVLVICEAIFGSISFTIFLWILLGGSLITLISKKFKWASAFLTLLLTSVVILHATNYYFPGFSSMINSQKESADNNTFHDFVPATKSEEAIMNRYKEEEETIVKEKIQEANSRFDYQESLRIMEEYVEKGNELKKEFLRIRSSGVAGNNVEEMIEMKEIDAIYLNQTNLGRINKPGLVKFYAPKPFQLVCSVVGQGGATLVNKPAGYSDQYFSSPGLILIHGSDRYDVQAEIP